MNIDWITVRVVHEDRVQTLIKDQRRMRKPKRQNPVKASLKALTNILS